ncbi:MAG: DNA polymerase I [Firmicutes bacterium]|nr:DNA polymerase I [Bacillota bacterium]
MNKKVMLIDGNSIVNRAFYGVPILTNSSGQYTNAIYGFFNILFKLLDEEKPEYLAVAFDLKAPTFRHEKYGEYKGTRREMPHELAEQIPALKEFLTALGVKQYSMEGFEADDILGTISKKTEEMGLETVVVSGDRDLLQIASDTLKVRIPKTKGGKTEVEDYYAQNVKEKYGVTPTEFIDVKALMGDASDNIPGVPSIGEKTAVKIIQEFKTLENALENAENVKPPKASKNLIEYKEQAKLSKYLAAIVRDVPIEIDLEQMKVFGSVISNEAYDIIKKFEFKSMLSRFSTKENDSRGVDENSSCSVLETEEELKKYISLINPNAEVSYILFAEEHNIKGIGLYQNGNGSVFVPVGKSVSQESFSEIVKGFFENEGIAKIGHNIKSDISLLSSVNISLKGAVFDTALAAYILNPLREAYNCDDIAAEFLEISVKSEEEVLGKGRSRKTLLSLENETLLEFAAPQAMIIGEAKNVMERKIIENNQKELFYEIEMPLLFVLSEMEKWGIKVNKNDLIQYKNMLETEIDKTTDEIYSLAGEEFNINSPKQLGVILFEKLGLKGSKKTKTGYSTAAETLEKLKHESPIVEKILYYRQIAKLKSTYADGLLSVMDKKTEKIYSTFNQTITATGRISSTEPNLQNIPIRLELGRELRKVFVPSDENFVFLDADYSQIELRVLAHMAGDQTLINAFADGQDIHRLTASQVFNIPFDEVTQKQRSDAKAVNFGIVYGIGAFSLSQDIGTTRREAEKYIESYFKKYPNIKTYMDRTIKEANENGYVSTIFGRRRPMPELSSSNFVQRSFGERVAMNMPIQGSAADIIKIAMIKVDKALRDRKLKSRLILQVHDELLVEAHRDEVEEVSALLKENMENAVNLSVPMIAKVNTGESWYETK